MTAATVARLIDHTLLKPGSTSDQALALYAEARELGAYAVCISPSLLPLATDGDGTDPAAPLIATVCGFPSGAHHHEIKAAEAARAVADRAAEVDMVIDLSLALQGRFDALQTEIAAVREGAGSAVLKVIIESAALDAEAIVGACRAAESAGADFVKTSTGFHPAGGASVSAVEIMHATVGGRLGIKASGGIRTAEDALRMITAGATRLGLSGSRAILDGLPSEPAES
ncbi:deoxyribose-phosphate aldolase [Bogoriella caseilytica]|uniref:deoxyribose-phosphate aldolase n=1 Tax=Bogoriella caseilytica TaxID=56055 RepID=UPI000F485EF7|nr:deoxyribose-phosphate aldolase [Bogoriella caseilytica]